MTKALQRLAIENVLLFMYVLIAIVATTSVRVIVMTIEMSPP